MDQPAFITVFSAEDIKSLEVSATGPLTGLVFAVKDNIDVAGAITTAGNPAATESAAESATAVKLLMNAGAVPIGKTNLDQYATGLVGTRSPYGACHSVFSDRHVSGGSSSGSAVAVAAGVVDFALGTDTAGSGRVPAAFNSLIGLKATRGLISTSGVFPACRSLDCVTVLTKSVSLARRLFSVLAVFDPADAFSRAQPVTRVEQRGTRPVIGVPSNGLDLDELHQQAWDAALLHAATLADIKRIDVSPFLQAAELLYSGPWIAERAVAFGQLVSSAGAGIDPTVRALVRGAETLSAQDAFRGMHRLAELARQTDPAWQSIDVLMLPTTPTHPTLAEVAAEPVTVNSRLGRFTNMTNLLDLAAIALPAGLRADGLPFGIQLLGPAFSDELLLDLAATWLGEPIETGGLNAVPDDAVPDETVPQEKTVPPEAVLQETVLQETVLAETVLLAVAGAHLSGQPLNHQLADRGATLATTTTMAPGYRMYEVPGPLPRPGVTRLAGPTREATSLAVEVWKMPIDQLGSFIEGIAMPLAIGPVELADGSQVLGFLCSADGVNPDKDITEFGGWRAYLASRR